MSLPDPRHLHQLDGSPFSSSNCMAACAAMALDAYTGGELRPTPDDIRRRQSDQSGGISAADAAEAWAKYGQKLHVDNIPPLTWAAVHDRLADGLGVIVTGSYGTVGAYSSQPSYKAGHALYLSRLAGASGVVVFDPLAQAPRVWPEDVVKRFATSTPDDLAFGEGTYVKPAKPTHRTRTSYVRLRTRPSIPGGTIAAVLVRAGGYARVEGTVQGSTYRLSDGRRSNLWHRIVARGSGGNARRIDPVLYSAALLWRPL